jgi:hypothetical protein
LHLLIVAGPSGAGKSSFLKELRAGRMAPDIHRALPPGVETWPLVHCNRPEQWQPFLADATVAASMAGLAVHYDIRLKWQRLRQQLAQDPFWDGIRRCDGITLVNIRPSPQRLLHQWTRDRLGAHPWTIHARNLRAAAAALLLAGIRRVRIARSPKTPNGTRYPRPLRFLKHVDHALRRFRTPPKRVFDMQVFNLYRRRTDLEGMLRSFDETFTVKSRGLPVRRIDVVPATSIGIGARPGWRIVALAPRQASRADAPTLVPAD